MLEELELYKKLIIPDLTCSLCRLMSPHHRSPFIKTTTSVSEFQPCDMNPCIYTYLVLLDLVSPQPMRIARASPFGYLSTTPRKGVELVMVPQNPSRHYPWLTRSGCLLRWGGAPRCLLRTLSFGAHWDGDGESEEGGRKKGDGRRSMASAMGVGSARSAAHLSDLLVDGERRRVGDGVRSTASAMGVLSARHAALLSDLRMDVRKEAEEMLGEKGRGGEVHSVCDGCVVSETCCTPVRPAYGRKRRVHVRKKEVQVGKT